MLSAVRLADTDEWRRQVRAALLSTPTLTDAARSLGVGRATLYRWLAEDPTLLGGLRVTVGSDVYDGTIRAGLAALATRF